MSETETRPTPEEIADVIAIDPRFSPERIGGYTEALAHAVRIGRGEVEQAPMSLDEIVEHTSREVAAAVEIRIIGFSND